MWTDPQEIGPANWPYPENKSFLSWVFLMGGLQFWELGSSLFPQRLGNRSFVFLDVDHTKPGSQVLEKYLKSAQKEFQINKFLK